MELNYNVTIKGVCANTKRCCAT